MPKPAAVMSGALLAGLVDPLEDGVKNLVALVILVPIGNIACRVREHAQGDGKLVIGGSDGGLGEPEFPLVHLLGRRFTSVDFASHLVGRFAGLLIGANLRCASAKENKGETGCQESHGHQKARTAIASANFSRFSGSLPR